MSEKHYEEQLGIPPRTTWVEPPPAPASERLLSPEQEAWVWQRVCVIILAVVIWVIMYALYCGVPVAVDETRSQTRKAVGSAAVWYDDVKKEALAERGISK